jgi:poly(3-hydroxybutyrate) depolymerase
MDMAYVWYEAAHFFLKPARAFSDMARMVLNNPANPFSQTSYARTMAASCELFERTTRRYVKPEFKYDPVRVGSEFVAIQEKIVWQKPFCNLIQFERGPSQKFKNQPKLLIVSPMSGHYATLLRGTVEPFLATHNVYITDWVDARTVPLVQGKFDLDDYIDYVMEICRHIGPDVHVMAVCQPAVPVTAATALMEADNDPCTPSSIILMGGPIDTRRSPTAVNLLAEKRGMAWFKKNCIVKVPGTYPGFWREVYPGFLQLSGFMAMNIDRHMNAHWDMYNHLVDGDGDSAEKHREFYDEYMAVMDLTAEFYLQTVDTVFVRHALPKGTMMHRDKPVDMKAFRRCAIMAIEGERDDISGVGQTLAALDLTPNLPQSKKLYHLQQGVGHYGVFNGSRYRKDIAPSIAAFIAKHDQAAAEPVKASAPHLRKVVG